MVVVVVRSGSASSGSSIQEPYKSHISGLRRRMGWTYFFVSDEGTFNLLGKELGNKLMLSPAPSSNFQNG